MADLLLVDNDARLTELMAWFLQKRGHDVRTAVWYAEARMRIEEREPDLMLADLELGRERGREEMQRMASAGSLPATLVVSGYLDEETERWLSSVPSIRGTLRKPFDLDKLEEAIESSLSSARELAIDDPDSIAGTARVEGSAQASRGGAHSAGGGALM